MSEPLDPQEAATLFYAGHPLAFVSDPASPFVCGQWMGQRAYITRLPFDDAEKYFTDNPSVLFDADATSPPVVVDTPYATGSGVVGEPLSCTMGNWRNEPTEYGYQWKTMQAGDPAPLPGATSPTYAPAEEDAGKDVFCAVLATNAAGSASADSNTITVLPVETRQRSAR